MIAGYRERLVFIALAPVIQQRFSLIGGCHCWIVATTYTWAVRYVLGALRLTADRMVARTRHSGTIIRELALGTTVVAAGICWTRAPGMRASSVFFHH